MTRKVLRSVALIGTVAGMFTVTIVLTLSRTTADLPRLAAVPGVDRHL